MSAKIQSVDDLLEDALQAIAKLRVDGTTVHCITNTVAQNFTANILLACGATPSMTVSPEEVQYFSSRSNAVLINLGTLDDLRKSAIGKSLEVCTSESKPFVLDPVMCYVSPPRLDFAKTLIKSGPAIIRVNKQEATSLEVDKSAVNSVVALTGEQDVIRQGNKEVTVANGHFWLSKVTAVGCAQGAIMAALITKTNEPLAAALGALILVGVAGENGARKSGGPGSFQTALIDELHSIPIPQLRIKASLS